MDEKAFLLQEIRYSKRKQNVKKFLRYESTGIAAGGTIAMVLEGCAVFVPFYTVHVWAVLAVLCGGSWRHLYGNEEMYHGTGSTADRPFRVSGTDRDGIWAYWKRG